MSSDLYRDLSWLLPTPKDFRARVKALSSSNTWEQDAQALAGYALNENDLGWLGDAITKGRRRGELKTLLPYRMGLIGNGTLDVLVPPLVATFARYGFALEVITHPYDQFVAEALNPQGTINVSRPDVVLVALDWHGLSLKPYPGNADAAEQAISTAIELIDLIRDGFLQGAGTNCILSTIVTPPETIAGSFDRVLAGSMRCMCDAVNQALVEKVQTSADILLDTAALAETVGLSNWHNPTLWNVAKIQFAPAFAPVWADHVGRLVAAMTGKSRRALVLDLDNTLWGGVIGDDGVEGILIGQGEATAEAHLEVQRTSLDLRSRGVVLSVSSKNTDEIARSPFVEHPDMLLKLDHFAIFQANWSDKATNITSIAKELALGLESFVFLDDNPAERSLVRSHLPQISVPELPADAALYARTLAAAGYFELTSFSAEDADRAAMYQMNAQRAVLKSQVTDMASYLASLDMEITFSPFNDIGRSRISQLINKSNQFNLTTRRYTENEVASIEVDPAAITLQVRLVDKFGDNGMISVLVGRAIDVDTLEIDTWLMSCRVLGRGVERMVLRELARLATQRGFIRLVGRYIPTKKNQLVVNHYATLGFTLVEGLESGETVWTLPVNADIEDAPMKVTSASLEPSPQPVERVMATSAVR